MKSIRFVVKRRNLPSGQLVLGTNASPYGAVFDMTDDVFTLNFDYSSLTPAICRGLVYNYNDTYLARGYYE